MGGQDLLIFAPALRVLLALETGGGGSGRHVLDLARGLHARGHDVTVLYSSLRAEPSFLSELHSLGVALLEAPMRRGIGPADLQTYLKILSTVRRHGPFDVIHAHSSKAGVLLRALPNRAAKIYTPHAFSTMSPTLKLLPRYAYGLIERGFARWRTDALIVVSYAEHEHAQSFLKIPDRKLLQICNGVERRALRNRAEVRRELALSDDAVLFGFVGRFSAQKHPLLFLQAIAAARLTDSRVRGVMLGTGELMIEILAQRDALNLTEAVAVLGQQDTARYFAGMDCLVMTSRYEAMPYVLLEALAAGLPIISTAVGGVSEAVQEGRTGFVVEADPSCVAAKMLSLTEHPDLLASTKGHARQHSQSFTVDKMVDLTEAAYRKVMHRVA